MATRIDAAVLLVPVPLVLLVAGAGWRARSSPASSPAWRSPPSTSDCAPAATSATSTWRSALAVRPARRQRRRRAGRVRACVCRASTGRASATCSRASPSSLCSSRGSCDRTSSARSTTTACSCARSRPTRASRSTAAAATTSSRWCGRAGTSVPSSSPRPSAAPAVVIRRLARATDPPLLLPLAVLGAGTALYLFRPSIAPDQIWAMRRFVPAGLPLLCLLAAVALAAGLDRLRTARPATRGGRPSPWSPPSSRSACGSSRSPPSASRTASSASSSAPATSSAPTPRS